MQVATRAYPCGHLRESHTHAASLPENCRDQSGSVMACWELASAMRLQYVYSKQLFINARMSSGGRGRLGSSPSRSAAGLSRLRRSCGTFAGLAPRRQGIRYVYGQTGLLQSAILRICLRRTADPKKIGSTKRGGPGKSDSGIRNAAIKTYQNIVSRLSRLSSESIT